MAIVNKKNKIALGQLAALVMPIVAMSILVGGSFSCASVGSPTGGPKDSIAPVVIRSIPFNGETNVNTHIIEIQFDEYVVPDLSQKLVVSPPLSSKPEIKTKGKGIIIKINEDLVRDRTYSFDFKDGIKDYNEGNILKNYRIKFSTSDRIDTLRINGTLVDAFTLAPVKDGTVMLYELDNDTTFRTTRPDYIAKTDDSGRFLFDNLQNKNYKLYALVDNDKNLKYSQITEPIAFIDSFITPDATFIEKIDTSYTNGDTIISNGFTKFSPDSFTVLMFLEDAFNSYLISSGRTDHNKMHMVFSETLSDSFSYRILGFDSLSVKWDYSEFSQNRDSIDIWIIDSTIAAIDSLKLIVDYDKSLKDGSTVFTSDTLKMFFSEPKKVKKKGKKDDDEEDEIPIPKVKTFDIKTNIGSSFDLNKKIVVEMPLPVMEFSTDIFVLKKSINDSTMQDVDISVTADSISKRKFIIDFKPEESTTYIFSVDSALITSMNGAINMPLNVDFNTQSLDYYGSIILSIEGFAGNGIIQLLKNTDKEEVVRSQKITENDNKLTLDYLSPEKYKLKIIDDKNKDGLWTTGNLDKKENPEPVYYFSKILKVRSNWEMEEHWIVDQGTITPKTITDDDPTADKSKKGNQKPNR